MVLRRWLPVAVLAVAVPVWVGAQSHGTGAVELYQTGRAAQRTEQYYRAIELYKTSLEQNPDYLEPIAGLAESFFALGEYEQAHTYVLRAQKLAKEDLSLVTLEGRILIGLGDFDGARICFENVVRKEPHNLNAQFGLAELDVVFGKQGAAVAKYERALSVSPENRRALLSLVLLLDERGDHEKAEWYAERALRLYPDNAQVRYIIARHLLADGNTAEAEYHARVAQSIHPAYLEPAFLLADIYLSSGAFDQVAEIVESLLAENRDDHMLWYILGTAYRGRGDYEEALNAYASAFRVQPDDEISRLALEDLLIEEFPLDDPRRSRFAAYHFDLGRQYRERNYLERALREFRRGLLIDPRSREGRLLYASVFATKGYPAKYLAELRVLADLGYTDDEILDQIEIQESILYNSLSNQWGVDQYGLQRHVHTVSLFLSSADLVHYGAGPALISYMTNLLYRYENIDVLLQRTTDVGFAAAFRSARTDGADYFLMVDFTEGERHFSASTRLYSAPTGTQLRSESTVRTGNNRVADAMALLTERLHNVLPVSGTIIRRSFDTALVDLGTVDGVEPEDEFYIVREDAVSAGSTDLDFQYDDADILGTLVVQETDELVSSGTIKRDVFFDLINVGDRIVYPPEEEDPAPAPEPLSSIDLYRAILKIR